jgi:hypothetical protein
VGEGPRVPDRTKEGGEREMRGNAVNRGDCNKTAGSIAVAGDAKSNCC